MRRLAFTLALSLVGAKDRKQYIQSKFNNTAMWKIFKPLFGMETQADQLPDKKKAMVRMYSLIVTMIPTSSTKHQIDGMENMINGFEATYYDMENYNQYHDAMIKMLADKRTQLRLAGLNKDIEDFMF